MEFVEINNFKSKTFEKVFREYYLEEGITLKENTIVFDEIQKSHDAGKTKCISLMENEEIIGFIMFKIMELSNDNGFIKEYIGHIEELYVIDKKRKQGLGKSLILKVEGYMVENNVKKLFLTAREHMYDFYIKLGYYIDESYECANKLKCLVKSL